MAKMFINYDLAKKRKPDNMHRFLDRDDRDEIVIGGTAKHVFKLDFDVNERCKSFGIIYRQGLTNVLDLSSNSAEVMVSDDGRRIVVSLSEEDTRRFVSHRDTYAQIKLVMNDGSVFYGDANELIIKSTLESLGEMPDGRWEAEEAGKGDESIDGTCL